MYIGDRIRSALGFPSDAKLIVRASVMTDGGTNSTGTIEVIPHGE